jgi:predicted Fe-Mo cluster-binding NifX family protein
MRIAISVESDGGLGAPICGHFGHSPFFALVDVEGEQVGAVNTVANPHYPQHAPGAIPQFIHSQGADVMLTGGMGARAVSFFEQFGVEPVTGASGTVSQALADYLGGRLTGVVPCHDHASVCDEHWVPAPGDSLEKTTEEEIRRALSAVMDPEIGHSIVDLEIVRDLRLTNKRVSF